jgi:PPOX class probable F420-dependent enzyme
VNAGRSKEPQATPLDPWLMHVLERMQNAVLTTIRRDGSPQISPVWYYWNGETISISTPNWTAKVKNVRRDPRVAVCVDDPLSGSYVAISGVADLIEGSLVGEATWPLLLKYLHSDEAAVRWKRINADRDRVVIVVRPNKIVSRSGVR